MRCGKSSCPSPQILVKAKAGGAIAIDETTVYFSSNLLAGSVQTCPLAGCDTPTLLAITTANMTNLALDATHVYWVDWSGNGEVLTTTK